jgi:hypothetical protein
MLTASLFPTFRDPLGLAAYEGVVSGDKLKSYGMTTGSDLNCSEGSDE